MQVVTFPGLNLTFKLSEVAIEIGGLQIHWYAVFIAIAIIMAMIIYRLYNGKFGIKFDDIFDMSLFVIPISVISARIYYILFNFEYYFVNPSEIFNVRLGGMAIYGSIIGGVITCYILCKIKKINFLDLLDYIVPVIALGQAIGRIGNFVNVEAYGNETMLPWRMGIYEGNTYMEVHPTFLYELLVTMSIFILLTIKKDKRKFKGEFVCIYLIIYGLGRAFIEGYRTDSLMLGPLRVSQILSMALFVIFTIIYLFKTIKIKKESKIPEKSN